MSRTYSLPPIGTVVVNPDFAVSAHELLSTPKTLKATHNQNTNKTHVKALPSE